MMKAKMMAGGGSMKAKMGASSKMPMVKKGGKMVPAFAADNKGKMNMGKTSKMKKSGGYK